MRLVFFEYLAKLMLRIVYGSHWEDKLNSINHLIPMIVSVSTFFWLFSLFFLWVEMGGIGCCVYAVSYPLVITVWAIIVRTNDKQK